MLRTLHFLKNNTNKYSEHIMQIKALSSLNFNNHQNPIQCFYTDATTEPAYY
jgi:hypothetical protein